MKKYIIKKLKLLGFINNKPKRRLYDKINEAKRIIKYKSVNDMIFVDNYDQVREILGYEDTLGMALFVRDFIARDIDTDKCIKHLWNMSSVK